MVSYELPFIFKLFFNKLIFINKLIFFNKLIKYSVPRTLFGEQFIQKREVHKKPKRFLIFFNKFIKKDKKE